MNPGRGFRRIHCRMEERRFSAALDEEKSPSFTAVPSELSKKRGLSTAVFSTLTRR